jgi:hypothetical protein
MTSATAIMESPTLIPTSDSAGKGEEGKVVVAEADNSKKEKQSLHPVKILAAATSETSPASGSSSSPTTTASKASPSNSKSPPSTKTTIDGNNPSSSAPSMEVIDSALLAALRDPRERLGLLKLEQNLIDFLEKQPQDSHMDIGGPYNSTVISPTLGYIGQQPQQLQAMAQPQPDGTNGGRPQTTFQRCILHRICDRFNMSRENSHTKDVHGCYLIRVCKGPDSKKPPRRLLNVKESEYQIPRPSPDSTSVNNGGGSNQSHHQLSSNFQQMNISSTPTAVVGNNSSSTKGRTKVGKMKIMKRSSSNVSNSSSGSNNSKAKNNANAIKARSSLGEKEKKYAEARARIFEQEEGSSSGNGDQSTAAAAASLYSNNGSGTTGASVPTTNKRGPQGNYYNNKRGSTNNDIHGAYPYSERGGAYNNYANSYNPNQQPSQSPSASSSAVGSATGNSKAPLHNSSTTSLNSMASNNSDGDQQQSTTTTRSKATYRNRQQEETDPDFRRGAGIQLQANPYAAHAHTAVGYGATGGGRGAANVYYPDNMVPANGNNNRVGYGYAQQQHYQYQHHPQQQYSAQQQQHAQYGGRGYAHSTMQYQQQRSQQEQHYPALSSSTTRK